MKKLLIFAVIFSAISIALAAQQFCSEIPITFQAISTENGVEPQEKHRVLHRYCDSADRLIDFTQLTQTLTLVYDIDHPVINRTSPFKGKHFGERFLMKYPANPADLGLNITLFPDVSNMNPLEEADHNMVRVRLTVNDLGWKMENDRTYVKGAVIAGEPDLEFNDFRLTPGWFSRLEGKQMLTQTLIPGLKSKLMEQNVFVVAGYLDIPANEGFRAAISHRLYEEDVMIFYEKPDLESERFNPSSSRVKIDRKVGENETVTEEGELSPGWFQEINEISQRTLFLFDHQTELERFRMHVTVYPVSVRHTNRCGSLEEHSGCLDAMIVHEVTNHHHDHFQFFTLYFGLENGNLEDHPVVKETMYQLAEIVPQNGQVFADKSPREQVMLTPGWVNLLRGPTLQTLRAYKGNDTELVEQRVTVTLGWNQFNGDSGFTAIYLYKGNPQPISIHLTVPPKVNQ